MKNRNSKTDRWKLLAWTLAGALALGLFGWQSIKLYRQRKETEAQAQAWRQEQGEGGEAEAEETDRPGPVMADVVEYEGKTYRRNTYVKAILCMGVDRKGSLEESQVAGSGGQADAIVLVAQDTARDQVRMLMLPRDTMTFITLTDLSGNVLGQDIQHLTLAYGYGDGREVSCEYMCQAVTTLLNGLSIDGYMAVSLGALPILNEGVGGVTVTIGEEGLQEADPSFTPGARVTLKGDLAEKFVRYRDVNVKNSALDRMERQKTYIQGFAEAAKNQAAREEGFAERMLEETRPYMVTNLDKGEYLDLAMAFLGNSQTLTQEDMITLPGYTETADLYDLYFPDLYEIPPVVLDLFYRAEEQIDTK